MKTTNNVQKAILKSLAVVTSLVLISFTVSAQGFWESLLENSTLNEIAYAMVEPVSESIAPAEFDSEMDANTFNEYLEVETEEALELEGWMFSEANFTAAFALEAEVEESMEVESWMVDEAYFAPESDNEIENVQEDEKEKVVLKRADVKPTNGQIMVKGEYIIGKNFIYHNVFEKEADMQLERWMVNSKFWRN